MRTERGAALSIAVITAILCAIGAYVVLMMATAQARHGKFFRQRNEARYVAEAGTVLAMQKLWNNPAYCGGPETVATPGGTTGVTVSVTNCGATNAHTISVGVSY
jgi:hypothetical protein